MDGVDKHNRLKQEIFSYRVSKDKKVFIDYMGKTVKILKDKESDKFLARAEVADDFSLQLLMAKATGNFKHGNEKVMK